ncbi:DNA polymerase III subunit alpha [Aquibacillus rhizosphaerae]|uniref:DNA polymerase III subunit alpha n=1 Tax=Aquibacillus rhizosphaerae TaxID=3051431 RepID=A0ABT7L496_9BACI|nr:DNA polymerase III subunit alpha [Aquibacillus sp. LR5S19]MDL4840669.1 DNA polymerase III subunit alpha [Aquibacillus sp. LR5S19]
MGSTHLQIRSGYSIMQSTITIDRLVATAKEQKISSIALTDVNVMHGVVSFYQACLSAGIKPIIGMILDVENVEGKSEQCIVLAKNNRGYKSLLKLSSHIQLQENKQINKIDLNMFCSDLIVIIPITASCLEPLLEKGELEQAATHFNKWKEIVKETQQLYLGVDESSLKNYPYLQSFCVENNIVATAISDIRFLHKSDTLAFNCLQAMRYGEKWTSNNIHSVKGCHLYSEEELDAIFSDWPTLLEVSNNIAANCNVKLNFDQRMLPHYPVPKSQTADNYLKELCHTSLQNKYNDKPEKVITRLNYELKVIKEMGFSDYFLIVWDFIHFAREQGITVGPGRGSAAGSLVAFLLGITNVDPIRYNLLFERFLNPERVTMPDIDIDFSDHRRDEVIQYVKNKYGQDHVAQIITFGTFATRSLLRELFKTMDIDSQDASFILKEIPAQGAKSIISSVKASSALTEYIKQSETLQLLFKIATKLEGLPRHVSTHAAGVIISEQPLIENVPLISSHGEIYLTQYAMKELESIGLLKIDFLGLRNLTLIERIISTINHKQKKKIELDSIPLDDVKTFSLLQSGKTNGVFQLESQGMQKVLVKLSPTNFEDVVAVNALYRPGPMEYIPVYINRKHKYEKVSYPHEDLRPILENTFGVLVYQEQIIQIASKLAGFTLGQADILRRAVSKKQKEEIEKERKHFIQGCLKNGYELSVAQELFDWIVRFSNYGFNRSHAVAYSLISYHLAYIKTHYPAYFLAEILSSVAGQQDKIRLYVREAKDLGILTLPPSINKSFGIYTVEHNNIRMGLLSIKGVGSQVIKEIIRVRKEGAFKHLFDFCLRVPMKIVNRQVIESLIIAGAFDETHSNRASLLATIDQAIEQGELFSEFEDQASFFQGDIELDASYIETEPFSEMKQLTLEKELIGMYMSSHPLSKDRNKLRAEGYIGLTDLKKHIGKNKMASAAVIQEMKVIRTKRGDAMAFVNLSDENGELEAVIFPEVYREVKPWIKEEKIVFIQGKIELRNERVQLLISEINEFDPEKLQLNDKHDKRVFIKLKKEKEKEGLLYIKQVAEENPGRVPVIVYHEQKKQTYQLTSEYNISLNQQSINALIKEFGKEQVVFKNKTT